MNDELLLTFKDVQRRRRLGRTKLYQLIESGELQAIKIGHARRLTACSVAAFVERHAGKVAVS
jgi:excisionase family DNA binding protein